MLNAKFFEILDENALHNYQKKGLDCVLLGGCPSLNTMISSTQPFKSTTHDPSLLNPIPKDQYQKQTNKQTKKTFLFEKLILMIKFRASSYYSQAHHQMAQGFFFFFFKFKINKKIANHKLDELTFKGEHRQDNYGRTKRGEQKFRGCLVCVFKQPFSVFKQHYTYFHTFFHPQMFSNNNFQFLNTYTKQTLYI